MVAPVTVTGRVNGDRRRAELEIRDAEGWRRIDRSRSDKKGGFTFSAPTRWDGKKRLRVIVPETRTHAAAKERVTVRVTPEYPPIGDRDA